MVKKSINKIEFFNHSFPDLGIVFYLCTKIEIQYGENICKKHSKAVLGKAF